MLASLSKTNAFALTIVIALAGGMIAQFAQLPAGMLMGGALAVALASVLGVPTGLPHKIRNFGFVIVGMTLGTNVAQDSLHLIPQWPYSLLGLALVLVLIVALCTIILTKIFHYDRATAYLSSFPGHLSFVLGIAESGYGDSRQIAIIQSIRVLFLTTLVPIVARIVNVYAPSSSIITPEPMQFVPLVVLAIACVAGGFVFQFLRVPAAFVLGPMLVATTGKLMGLYDGTMPVMLNMVGFVLMGALIGSRFSHTTLEEMKRAALGGVVVSCICIAVVSGVCFGLTYFVDMPFGQLWMGLSPGALESMGALGLALGFDTAFIAAHHTARFFLLTLSIPTVGLVIKRQPVGEDGKR